jgi:hypothetical protein
MADRRQARVLRAPTDSSRPNPDSGERRLTGSGTVKPVSIKAPSLAQQNAQVDDNVARAHLEQRRRETAHHARALKLRERHWELAADRGELRSCTARVADLELQNQTYRQQLALVVTRAVARNRALRAQKPRPSPPASKSGSRIRANKRRQSRRPKPKTRRS